MIYSIFSVILVNLFTVFVIVSNTNTLLDIFSLKTLSGAFTMSLFLRTLIYRRSNYIDENILGIRSIILSLCIIGVCLFSNTVVDLLVSGTIIIIICVIYYVLAAQPLKENKTILCLIDIKTTPNNLLHMVDIRSYKIHTILDRCIIFELLAWPYNGVQFYFHKKDENLWELMAPKIIAEGFIKDLEKYSEEKIEIREIKRLN